MTESEFLMFFGQKILDYKEDILKDLDELIKIKSVSSQGSEMPSKALEWILQKAENMGFTTKISTVLQVTLNTVTVKNLPLYLHTLM